MKRDGLTEKQRRFCSEYPIDLNGTRAAIRAGYSPNGAEVTGHRLLRNTKVAAQIDKALQERVERTELSADEVIEGLRREANYRGDGASHSARVQALSWLGRHKAMFLDRSQVEVKGLADRIAAMGDDEVRELLELGSDEEIMAQLAGRIGHA